MRITADDSYSGTDLESMIRGYLDAALWTGFHYASEDSEPLPLDGRGRFLILIDETDRQAREDCRDFLSSLFDDDEDFHGVAGVAANQRARIDYLSTRDYADMGHDFHLSRNGHGTGFWDRGLGESGDRLHELAKAYGTAELIAYGDAPAEWSN